MRRLVYLVAKPRQNYTFTNEFSKTKGNCFAKCRVSMPRQITRIVVTGGS